MPSGFHHDRAYHVLAPDGKPCVWTVATERRLAIDRLLPRCCGLWPYAVSQGYRVVELKL